MSCVAILLGRKNSKGFPGKNTFPIMGRPLVSYPLQAANDSKYVSATYVSTDSQEIAEIAIEHSAKVIKRPKELCSDSALGSDAYAHAYHTVKKEINAEIFVLLFANAATVSPELIDKGVEILLKNPEIDSAVTVSSYNMWSPLRARKVNDQGLLEPFVPFETFGDPKTLNCDRDSQGQVWFADMGASIVRARCLENVNDGLLPQPWMGNKIAPIYSDAGCDIDYPWQIPQTEYWITQNLKYTESHEHSNATV